MTTVTVMLAAAALSGEATVPASAEPDLVILSGEVRERATLISNIEWNPDDPNNGWFWTQRVLAVADVDAAPRVRARVAILSALQEGGQIVPVERNNFDLQEGYVELGPEAAFVRLGRQEVRLGSQRLVAWREGTNVRRTWDGARGVIERGAWRVDVLALRLVDVETEGVFNDESTNENTLAGFYATGPTPVGEVDLYYLYAGFEDRPTVEGTADQDRYTVGARAFGDRRGWFWNWEAAYQLGSHGDLGIAAWTVAANTGYRWNHLPWAPEIELLTNIASGDEVGGDGELNTFDALYPRGSYFSEAAILGPSNFYNVHPYLRASPRDDLSVFVDVNFYWRLERADGVYGPPGNIIRGPGGSNAQGVANALSMGAEWTPSENTLLRLLYTHSAPQAFIEETGPAVPVNFVEATFALTF